MKVALCVTGASERIRFSIEIVGILILVVVFCVTNMKVPTARIRGYLENILSFALNKFNIK